MKKNISEALDLDIIDGSNVKDKQEEEHNKNFKQVQKELEKAKKQLLDEQLVLNEAEDEPNESPKDLGYANMLNSLIKSEWDAIELYNSMLLTFEDEKKTDIVKVLNDIVKEEYIHIGQLEKLLQNYSTSVDNIEAGQVEAEEQINS